MAIKNNQDVKTIIEWFKEYCIEEKGYDEKTVFQYVSFINSYLSKFVDRNLDFSNSEIFTLEKINTFKNSYTGTLVRYSFSAFITFLYDKKFIDEHMFKITLKNLIHEAFPYEKNISLREQVFLSPSDIRILFSKKLHFNIEEDKFIFPLVIGLSYFCLFNQKELIALNIEDIDIENKTLNNVRERNNINYSPKIKMNDTLYELIYHYLDYRNKQYPNTSINYFFIYRGEPLNNKVLNNIYNIAYNKKNQELLKSTKLNTGLILKSSILYMLRYSEKNVLIELCKLIGTNFYSTTYFMDAFEEYAKNDFVLQEDHHVSLQDITRNLPQTNVKNSNPSAINDESNDYSEENDVNLQDIEDYEMNKKQDILTSKIIVQRLVRDSKISRELKKFYNNTCIICDTKLRKSNNEFYSEAHHIQPYNKTHRGTDSANNLIILCSNCHTQFDDSYYAINPIDKKLYCLNEDDKNHLKSLNLKHQLDESSLEYAWQLHLLKK